MLTQIRQRLTYANIMATMAVFMGLGGSAYAVTKIDSNSVKSRHIVNGQVRSPDVRSNGLTGTNIAESTLGPVPSATKAGDANNLDGLDQSAFLRSGGKAADSNLLDGLDQSAFLRSGGKAADADLLDGKDASGFLARSAVVGADGTIAEQSGGISVTKNAFVAGVYLVDFGAPVTGSVQATIGGGTGVDGGEVQANLCTGSNSTGINCSGSPNDRSEALVYTFDSTGARADRKFTLTALP